MEKLKYLKDSERIPRWHWIDQCAFKKKIRAAVGLCPQGESTRKGLKKKRKRKERKEGRKERKKGEDDGRMKENERRTDECRKRATNDERAQRKEANKPSSHMLRHVASCDVTGHFMNRSFGQLRPLLRIEFKPNSIIALTNLYGEAAISVPNSLFNGRWAVLDILCWLIKWLKKTEIISEFI